MTLNELTEKIIGAAIRVHRILGPGFLESVYQAALAYELEKTNIPFEKEKTLPAPYKDIFLDAQAAKRKKYFTGFKQKFGIPLITTMEQVFTELENSEGARTTHPLR